MVNGDDLPNVETHSHSSLLVTLQPVVQSHCHPSSSPSLSSSTRDIASVVDNGMMESVIYYHASVTFSKAENQGAKEAS